MAKLFYTIDEAAAKLGKTGADLHAMVENGQLEQFVMHNTPHFKRAAIDQLVTDDVGDLDLSLGTNSASDAPLNLSGSGDLGDLKFEDTGSRTAEGSASEFDLGLDDALSMADSGAAPAPTSGPMASEGSSIADFHQSGSHAPIGLADSAGKSAIRTPSPATGGAGGSGAGSALDLGLDLDLGLEAPAGSGGASSGGVGLADSGAPAKTPRSADLSGSMAARSGSRAPRDRSDSSDGLPMNAPSDSGSLNLETVGSGSGMLDLAGDADQSTMGAALLEDPGDGGVDSEGVALSGADDLFADGGGAEADEAIAPSSIGAPMGSPGVLVPAASIAVDTAASGLSIGLLAGALASIILVATIVVSTRMGGGSAMAGMVTGDLLMWLAALAGGTIVAGGIGFFVGRAIE